MFKRAKKYLTLQMLATMEPQKLIHLSEQKTLKAFLRAADHIPAYSQYLKEQGVDPQNIQTINDFRTSVPVIDKDKTFRLYSRKMKKLCLLGEVKDVRTIICSSGHSGCFSYGLNTQKELKKNQESIDFLLEYLFQVESKKTLLINCLPMGIKVHAETVTVVEENWWLNCKADRRGALLHDLSAEAPFAGNLAAENPRMVQHIGPTISCV